MIIGIYGFQDSGKTLLVEDLVKTLVGKGYNVASVKHTAHAVSVDSEGKDTWRHWKAGSDPVVLMSSIETTTIRHSPTSEEDVVRAIMADHAPDVIVIEGNKRGGYPKVRLGTVPKTPGTVLNNPTLKALTAYVENGVAFERARRQLAGLDCGKCGLDCDRLAKAIADGRRRVADCKELSKIRAEALVGGRSMPMGKFVSEVVDGTVRGMLSTMKGYEPGKDVEIRLSAKRAETKKRRRSS